MTDKKNLTYLLSNTKSNQPIDQLKFSLYSAYTELILSKEFFPENSDLMMFFSEKKIYDSHGNPFKPYLFKSRTLILARTTRLIYDTISKSVLVHLLDESKRIVFGDNTYKNTSKSQRLQQKGNRFDEVLDQFSRKE
ncbi:hypothetical protein [Lacticaseibacillus paracasei]|uniref:hypothetical protein n=1 Tax=Lacticaseibacillus paracasei TaxID=1597 RepID=UPI0025A0AF63|nr:hypothetical protein [Lacticaseibacillus paracasei]MDM7531945.1 hypothetical protein [Lacticaseibacillus paracasei]